MALSSTSKVKSELEIYRQKAEDNADILDFVHSILKIQNRALKDSKIALRGTKASLEKRFMQGQRLLRSEEVVVPRGEYLKALEAIETEISKRWKAVQNLGQLSRLDELSNKNFTQFLRAMVSGKRSYLRGLPSKTRIRKATLQFALESAAVPFMSRLSSEISRKMDLSSWGRRRCPVCGRMPVLARLRQEEGARMLYCAFCTTEWRFPRIKCVNCGNEDQFSMKYFYSEDDRGHRVDVCDKCKVSIRTIDERTLERETLPEVENWVTSFLNDVAEREGYRPIG